jgi:hypothetical protein
VASSLTAFAAVDPLDNWHLRTIPGPAFNLQCISFGEGTFVAVGDQGTIVSSTDGINWVAQNSQTTNNLSGIAFDGGSFVVVGSGGTILGSVDGVSWVNHSYSNGTLGGIAFGNGIYVATDIRRSSARFYRSQDSISWTNKSVSPYFTLSGGIAFGDGKFVALGIQAPPCFGEDGCTPPPPTPRAFNSTNGLTWIVQSLPTTNLVWRDVAHSTNLFLTVGANGSIMMASPDLNWSLGTSGITNNLLSIAFAGNVFVITGDSGTVLTSSDGTNWTQRQSGSLVSLRGTAYGNGIFVIVGDSGTVLQAGSGAREVSVSLSQVHVAPSTVLADGQSEALVTVKLLDSNGDPVSGKIIQVNAFEQARDGPVGVLSTVRQPTSPTDSKGQVEATIVSTIPGRAIISVQDITDGILLQQQPKVDFTPAFVPPNTDLAQAIETLYQNTVGTFGTYAIVGNDAAAYGDQFRGRLFADEASALLDAAFGLAGTISSSLNAVKYARVLALPGLEEIGIGPLIKDRALLSRLFDTELLHSELSSRVLESVFREIVIKDGAEELAKDLTDSTVRALLEEIAFQAAGLTKLQQNTTPKVQVFRQSLAARKQTLLEGIPPMTAAQQTAWAADLQERLAVSFAFLAELNHQDHFLQQLSAAKAVSSQDAVELMLAKFAVTALATLAFDGPGALITGGIITASDEYKDIQNIKTDQAGYSTAFAIVGGCLQYDGQIYLDCLSAYEEIARAKSSNPVSGHVSKMTDWEDGYDSWGPSHLNPRFSVTRAYSLLHLINTSTDDATFEVIVTWEYPSSAFGVSIPNLSRVTTAAMRVPASSEREIPITYYNGQKGGRPDPSYQMVVYVLGNNSSGTFYITKFSHDWAPLKITIPAKGLDIPGSHPLDLQGEIENPVTTYVDQIVTDQNYQARIFAANPYVQMYSVVITQSLPSGIIVMNTDGSLEGSQLVWTNAILANGVAKHFFTFRFSLTPGALTNLPPAIATFLDQTNNSGSLLSSVAPQFSGLFPVQVNASIPGGVLGTAVPLVLMVTNRTDTNQIASISLSLEYPGGTQAINLIMSLSLTNFASSNVTFSLPPLASGSYKLAASLSINGGLMEFLNGLYIVPSAPIRLADVSLSRTITNGFTFSVQAPKGSSYLIEVSTNLVDWDPLHYFFITNSPMFFTESPADYAKRFYRAVIQ